MKNFNCSFLFLLIIFYSGILDSTGSQFTFIIKNPFDNFHVDPEIKALLANQNPRVYLLSFPRSGNTWLRYCIELLTERPTAEYAPDHSVANGTHLPLGYLAGHHVDLSKVPVWKVHHMYHLDFGGYYYNPKRDSLLFLLRNPKEAIARQSETKEQNDSEIQLVNLKWYFNDLGFFDAWYGKKLLVYYEDLIKNPRMVLTQVLLFLGESDNRLEDFFQKFEQHKIKALGLYDLLGGSKSKGNDLLYHSQKMSSDERKNFDTWIIENYPLLWKKYLKDRYSEE